MTSFEFSFAMAAYLLLSAVILVAAWLSFRRTRVGWFLILGAVLVLWPFADGGLDRLLRHAAEQAFAGQTPALFPFSLMGAVGDSWTGEDMRRIGRFIAWFKMGRQLLYFLLLAATLLLVARGLKHNPHRPVP